MNTSQIMKRHIENTIMNNASKTDKKMQQPRSLSMQHKHEKGADTLKKKRKMSLHKKLIILGQGQDENAKSMTGLAIEPSTLS